MLGQKRLGVRSWRWGRGQGTPRLLVGTRGSAPRTWRWWRPAKDPVTQLRHEGEILLVNLVAPRSRGLAVLVIARAGSPLLAVPGDVAPCPAGGAHHVFYHIGLVLTLPSDSPVLPEGAVEESQLS